MCTWHFQQRFYVTVTVIKTFCLESLKSKIRFIHRDVTVKHFKTDIRNPTEMLLSITFNANTHRHHKMKDYEKGTPQNSKFNIITDIDKHFTQLTLLETCPLCTRHFT